MPTDKTSPTLCLAMLVRDEVHTLKRCLTSVIDLIDQWVIIDTGGATETKQIVTETLGYIPGKYLVRPFTDFAEVRNQLLSECESGADYLLLLDADEVVSQVQPDFKQNLKSDLLHVEIESPYGSRTIPRILRAGESWTFCGSVAERLVGTEQASYQLADDFRIFHYLDGYRHQNFGAQNADIDLLQTELDTQPNDKQVLIALADGHLTQHRFEDAITHYAKVSEGTGNDVLKWYALYKTGLCQEQAGQPVEEVLETLTLAFECLPQRAEPLYHIARICGEQDDLQRALDINDIAIDTPLSDKRIFFERTIYEHLIPRQHAELCVRGERREKTKAYLNDILWRHLPWQAKANADTLMEAVEPIPATDSPSEVSREAPQGTPIGERKKLTIGMATYDDYDGVYFSVQAIRMYHPEVTEDTEILVIDNNPTGPCASALKELDSSVAGYRYIPYDKTQSTTVKQQVFVHANADIVLCIDCHVLIVPGAIKKLLDYFESKPDCKDLIQGPLMYNNMKSLSTHFEPKWRGGMYGVWAEDERGLDEAAPMFDIPMQGMGLFACRKSAWPGFNPLFSGFGGEEAYIHEKFRQRGGRTLCAPFLRWLHRFGRPMGAPYQNIWEDRIRNYLIGFNELGLDLHGTRKHFAELINLSTVNQVERNFFGEISRSLAGFDRLYFISTQGDSRNSDLILRHFRRLGHGQKIRILNVDHEGNSSQTFLQGHIDAICAAKQARESQIFVGPDSLHLFYRFLATTSQQQTQTTKVENQTLVPSPPKQDINELKFICAYRQQIFDQAIDVLKAEQTVVKNAEPNNEVSSQIARIRENLEDLFAVAAQSGTANNGAPTSTALPAVSCFCITYGRPHLLEESIECFLRQDYRGPKELVILNDFDRQHLYFDHPEIRIINVTERYDSIGGKRNASIEHCQHDILLPWDDDDIYLPHRLSMSVNALIKGKEYFKPSRAYYSNEENKITQIGRNSYHPQSAWTRNAFNRAGGYKPMIVGDDTELEISFHKLGIARSTELTNDELFYVYRWASSGSYHISGFGLDGQHEVSQLEKAKQYVMQLVESGATPTGQVELNPHWKHNYLLWTTEHLESLEKQ